MTRGRKRVITAPDWDETWRGSSGELGRSSWWTVPLMPCLPVPGRAHSARAPYRSVQFSESWERAWNRPSSGHLFSSGPGDKTGPWPGLARGAAAAHAAEEEVLSGTAAEMQQEPFPCASPNELISRAAPRGLSGALRRQVPRVQLGEARSERGVHVDPAPLPSLPPVSWRWPLEELQTPCQCALDPTCGLSVMAPAPRKSLYPLRSATAPPGQSSAVKPHSCMGSLPYCGSCEGGSRRFHLRDPSVHWAMAEQMRRTHL